MPNIVHGESFRQTQLPDDVTRRELDYDYPDDLDLKPGSKLHQDLVGKILQRATESSQSMSRRFSSWNTIDEVLTTYAQVDDKEQELLDDDPRKPVTIVFPYSFVIMETMLSYLVSAFFQDPVFRYEGRSPEDIIGAEMFTYVIQQQCNKAKVLLNAHTIFRDCVSYGMGIGAPYWKIEEGYRTRGVKGPYGPDKMTEEAILYEGNALANIDPYMALPDPNVSISDVQDGEFFGYVELSNYMNMLTEEKTSEDLFIVRYLKTLNDKKTSVYAEDASAREAKYGGRPLRRAHSVTNEVDNIHMFIKLIPKEWKLGDEEYPEKWHFTVSGDSILVRAKPLGLNHDKFPIAIAAPDFDGYSTTPISRMEIMSGMQHVLDFLFNSHITNVRKAINDMFVVDPYIVNIADLKDPKAGKIIRTRRPVWGQGVKDAIQQLGVVDITRANIGDTQFIMEHMEKVGASSEAMMGHLRKSGPERLTGKEFEGTSRGSFSRMERMAKVIGIQAMQDIGYFFAHHAQQLMTEETYIKTVGAWPESLKAEYGDTSRIKVSPYDILIDYDLITRDGSVPGSNFSGVWMEMFKVLSEHPELQQTFDSVRIFKHIARNSGAKNVDQFVKVKAMPDEAVMDEVQKGNITNFNLGGQ
jgi:hypothetical protein